MFITAHSINNWAWCKGFKYKMDWGFEKVCLDNGGEKKTNASTIEKFFVKCKLSQGFFEEV